MRYGVCDELAPPSRRHRRKHPLSGLATLPRPGHKTALRGYIGASSRASLQAGRRRATRPIWRRVGRSHLGQGPSLTTDPRRRTGSTSPTQANRIRALSTPRARVHLQSRCRWRRLSNATWLADNACRAISAALTNNGWDAVAKRLDASAARKLSNVRLPMMRGARPWLPQGRSSGTNDEVQTHGRPTLECWGQPAAGHEYTRLRKRPATTA